MTRALPMFERPDVCGPCGGVCCKHMPGAALPEDFGLSAGDSIAPVRAALASGRWSLDWWEGDPRPKKYELSRALFVRPRIVNAPVADPSFGGRCSWLGEHGCTAPEERPSGCRGLEPSPPRCVVRHSSKQDAAIAWLPFAAELEKLAAEHGRPSYDDDDDEWPDVEDNA